MKKILRYIAIAALVVGIAFIAYGAAVNQVALNAFMKLFNERGFKAFILGVALVVVAVALFAVSLAIGKDKEK